MSVTTVNVNDVKIGDDYIQIIYYQGLSTDTKPTTNVGSGSIFDEIDTGKIFKYDANNTNSVTSNGWWEVT